MKTKSFTNRVARSCSIQTALFPGNLNVKQAANALQQHGLDVRPILSPTVPAGAERLRICIHTYNSDDEIILLASTLEQLGSQG
jgi:8-amino-7-oxononanoate synthase